MNEGRDTYVVGNSGKGGNYGRERTSGGWTVLGDGGPGREKRRGVNTEKARNYSTEENPAYHRIPEIQRMNEKERDGV